jgi:N6-adenosine-specific RNA methylase IME4
MVYKVIYADPPWHYNDKALAGDRGAGCKYDVMGIDALKRLDVPSICDDDCLMFMWVTMPQLPVGLDLIQAWGFKYKTAAFTWVKRNKVSPSWFWGMGNWTRANAEVCLLGTRGKPGRASAAVHSVVDDAVRKHSQKPEVVRDRIVQLCGNVPRLEMFARTQTPGWAVFGNEVENSINIPRRALDDLVEAQIEMEQQGLVKGVGCCCEIGAKTAGGTFEFHPSMDCPTHTNLCML